MIALLGVIQYTKIQAAILVLFLLCGCEDVVPMVSLCVSYRIKTWFSGSLLKLKHFSEITTINVAYLQHCCCYCLCVKFAFLLAFIPV